VTNISRAGQATAENTSALLFNNVHLSFAVGSGVTVNVDQVLFPLHFSDFPLYYKERGTPVTRWRSPLEQGVGYPCSPFITGCEVSPLLHGARYPCNTSALLFNNVHLSFIAGSGVTVNVDQVLSPLIRPFHAPVLRYKFGNVWCENLPSTRLRQSYRDTSLI